MEADAFRRGAAATDVVRERLDVGRRPSERVGVVIEGCRSVDVERRTDAAEVAEPVERLRRRGTRRADEDDGRVSERRRRARGRGHPLGRA